MFNSFRIIILILFSSMQNLYAADFYNALQAAYLSNPELNAERENISVSEEDLKISKSEFLPSVTITGTKSEATTKKLTDRDGTNASITDVDTETQTVTIEQTIFQGLGGKADLDKSKIGINLAKAKLLKKEQEVI